MDEERKDNSNGSRLGTYIDLHRGGLHHTISFPDITPAHPFLTKSGAARCLKTIGYNVCHPFRNFA